MAAKSNRDEENAWQDYLASIERKPAKKPKKAPSLRDRLSRIFRKLGLGRKAGKKDLETMKKQIEISAEERRKSFTATLKDLEKEISKIEKEEPTEKEKKKLTEKEKKKAVEKERKKPAVVEKYLKKIGKKEKVVKKKKVKKKARKAKKKRARKKAKAKRRAAVSKKIALLPKAEMAEEKLGLTPSLAKKSIAQIKRLSPKKVEREIELEKMVNKARGWYGDNLLHKRAALVGWRVRKRDSLHSLRKKSKEESLSEKELATKKELAAADRSLRQQIREIDNELRSLKEILRSRKKEEKTLEKKAKEAGIEVSKEKIEAMEKGKKKAVGKESMQNMVEAMRAAADEMSMAVQRQRKSDISWKESLSIEDEIDAHKRMIKNLEIGFYKRKVDFDQFREKLFEYQTKLSELNIKKGYAEEKKAKMSPKVREMMEGAASQGTDLGNLGIGLTPKTIKGLERLVEKQGLGEHEERTAKALEKLADREAERGAAREEGKRFAQGAVKALEAIAKKFETEPGRRGPERMPGRAAHPERREERAPERPAWLPEEKPERDELRAQVRRRPAPREEFIGPPAPRERVSGAGLPRTLGREIRQKADVAGLSKQDIERLESKLSELIQKYKIPEQPVVARVQNLDSARLVQDFQKLISMIEVKKERAIDELIKPVPGYDFRAAIIPKKKEKIVGTEKTIRKARIETAFDRLLNLVQVKGIVSLKEATKELGMDKRDVQECAAILEKSKLIKLMYPPIGSVKLAYPGYLEWKAKQKKKKKEKKKKEK